MKTLFEKSYFYEKYPRIPPFGEVAGRAMQDMGDLSLMFGEPPGWHFKWSDSSGGYKFLPDILAVRTAGDNLMANRLWFSIDDQRSGRGTSLVASVVVNRPGGTLEIRKLAKVDIPFPFLKPMDDDELYSRLARWKPLRSFLASAIEKYAEHLEIR